MTLKTAYNITRPFYKRYIDNNPFPISSFEIHVFKEIVYFFRDTDKSKYFIRMKVKQFNKEFNKYELEEITADKDNQTEKYKIISTDMMTAKGIVSEDDYFLAEDIMNEQKTIKKKDLIQGDKYLGINGEEYIYLGNLYFTNILEKLTRIEAPLIFNIKRGRLALLNSIRLVEYLGSNKEKLRIDINSYLLPNKESSKIYKLTINSKVDNLTFI